MAHASGTTYVFFYNFDVRVVLFAGSRKETNGSWHANSLAVLPANLKIRIPAHCGGYLSDRRKKHPKYVEQLIMSGYWNLPEAIKQERKAGMQFAYVVMLPANLSANQNTRSILLGGY